MDADDAGAAVVPGADPADAAAVASETPAEEQGPLVFLADSVALPRETGEFPALTSEMAASLRRRLEYLTREYKMSLPEAWAQVTEPSPEVWLARCRGEDPEQMSWAQFTDLAVADPQAAQAKWEETRQAARDQVRGGYAAVKAVEGYDATPWSRALFLAVLDEMAEEWKPRGGMEWTLLVQCAQAHTMFQYWLQGSVNLLSLENGHFAGGKRGDDWERNPRLTSVEATNRAVEMADRWHRIFLRNLRALRDLRRYGPVVIENHGQVNIAEKQVNQIQTDGRNVSPG